MRYYLIGKDDENGDYIYLDSFENKKDAYEEMLEVAPEMYDIFIIKGEEIYYRTVLKWFTEREEAKNDKRR